MENIHCLNPEMDATTFQLAKGQLMKFYIQPFQKKASVQARKVASVIHVVTKQLKIFMF